MSAQFCLGNALVRRRLAFADLEACDDPLTADHARRIAVLADASVAERHCRITVDWQDGRSSTRTLERPVGRPLFADVARFAAGLAEEMELTEAAVARIVDVVANLEREPDLARLVSGLMAAGRPDRLADRDAPAGLSAPV
jgi:hypothetical protein